MMSSVSNTFTIHVSIKDHIVKQSIYFESKFNFDLNYVELMKYINKEIPTDIYIKSGFNDDLEFLNKLCRDLKLSSFDVITIDSYHYNMNIKTLYSISATSSSSTTFKNHIFPHSF